MDVKNWSQLTNFQTPIWMKDQKFGIYTHWGIYSVPAFGPNVSWYPHKMYQEGSSQFQYHCNKYGHPSKFGYKDFIPMFTAKNFDPDEWAELFCKAGAKFAGPVAEHHDGFSMWNSKVNKWNAKEMGPMRDVVGELEIAIRKQKMKYVTAFHHAENWKFYPHWVKEYDTSNDDYKGLYGEAHNTEWGSERRYLPEPFDSKSPYKNQPGCIDPLWMKEDLPNKQFCDQWFLKLQEVIDGYHPDYIYFDFGLDYIPDEYKRKFLTYYFEDARQQNKEYVVSYKWHNLPNGSGLIDLEQGCFSEQTYHDWITDTTIDDGEAWGYMQDCKYKSSKQVLHYLIDNVSKNGYLLLNVGPKPDGTIPDEAKQVLLEVGDWLSIYGEAIYGTRPWVVSEEGPTRAIKSGAFSETSPVSYTAEDIRYTMKNNIIYAICLGKVGNQVTLTTLSDHLYPNEIASIETIEEKHILNYSKVGRNIIIDTHGIKADSKATVLKIVRKPVYEINEK